MWPKLLCTASFTWYLSFVGWQDYLLSTWQAPHANCSLWTWTSLSKPMGCLTIIVTALITSYLGVAAWKRGMRKCSIWNIMTDSWYQEDLLRRYQRDQYYNGSTEQNCSQHHEHNTHFSIFLFKMRQIRRRDFNYTFMRSNSICCGFNIKSNSWCNNIWRAFESV